MRSLVIVYSFHHKNTLKVAGKIASVLDAEIMKPDQVRIEDLSGYDLIGFGSGIYDAKHHDSVLELARNLTHNDDVKVFIFSTTGVPKIGFNEEFVAENHKSLRTVLELRQIEVVGDFSSLGHNTNSFLKFTSGLNKGRPNHEDLRRAEEFALKLREEIVK